jgi:glycosyltransferase involved in cell wall biosynthesis
MKILFVPSLYRPNVGGIETMVEEMGRWLKRAGHEVMVLTKRWPRYLPAFDVLDGMEVHRVSPASTVEEYAEAAGEVASLMDQLRADVVHVVGMRRPLPLHALLLARTVGAPIIGTIAGGEIPDPAEPSQNWVWEAGMPLIEGCFKRYDRLTSVSRATSSLARMVIGDLSVQTIPVGIDFDWCRSVEPVQRDRPFIVSLRRLEHSKGVDTLIRAFSLIAVQQPNLELVIAGDGSERQRLEDLVVEMGLRDRISFLGSVTLERAMGLLRGASVSLVPSRSEAGGLANTQSNAVGCPLVACAVGGIGEYTRRDAAWLVPPDRPDEMARAVLAALEKGPGRTARIRRGIEVAKSMDWATILPAYVHMYEQVITTGAARAFEPWSDEVVTITAAFQTGLSWRDDL